MHSPVQAAETMRGMANGSFVLVTTRSSLPRFLFKASKKSLGMPNGSINTLFRPIKTGHRILNPQITRYTYSNNLCAAMNQICMLPCLFFSNHTLKKRLLPSTFDLRSRLAPRKQSPPIMAGKNGIGGREPQMADASPPWKPPELRCRPPNIAVRQSSSMYQRKH